MFKLFVLLFFGYLSTMQGFNWESCNRAEGLYNSLKNSIHDFARAGITHVWLPPPTHSVSPQGIHFYVNIFLQMDPCGIFNMITTPCFCMSLCKLLYISSTVNMSSIFWKAPKIAIVIYSPNPSVILPYIYLYDVTENTYSLRPILIVYYFFFRCPNLIAHFLYLHN